MKDENIVKAAKLTMSISRLGLAMQGKLGAGNPAVVDIEQYLTEASKNILFACEVYKRARR